MSKRKPIDTGARADVVESLRLMRTWLATNESADVNEAWWSCPHVNGAHARLMAFVLPGHPHWLPGLSTISTPAYSLKWLDTVIAHDTRELKARGVL